MSDEVTVKVVDIKTSEKFSLRGPEGGRRAIGRLAAQHDEMFVRAKRLLLAVEAIYPSEVFRTCENDSDLAREIVQARDELRAFFDE